MRSHGKELEAFNLDLTQVKKEWQCKVCDGKFYTAGALNYHKKTIHAIHGKSSRGEMTSGMNHGKSRRMPTSKPKEGKCNLCYFDTKNLRSHKRYIHRTKDSAWFGKDIVENDLKYECESCYLKFVSENSLNYHKSKEHKKTHKSSRSRSISLAKRTVQRQATYCNLCYVDMNRPKLLQDHRDKIHTSAAEKSTFVHGEVKHSLLKYKCALCEKRFISKSSMRYHRQHAHKQDLKRDADSDISCEFCPRVFKWRNRQSLRLHIKTVHKVQDYDVTEHSIQTPETNAVENFNILMNLL